MKVAQVVFVWIAYNLYGFAAAGRYCKTLEIPMCQDIGYERTFTLTPNIFNHQNQEEAGIEIHQFFPLVKIECSPDLRMFLCLLYAPPCSTKKDKSIPPPPPCRSLCESAKAGCEPTMNDFGFDWPERLNCKQFPEDGGLCISPAR
ncbi:frizzled-7-like [Saccoglossus kowalevskii]|uniref:Frizzled-7-like n=1 Tax=Saccoglossus kowalevskii TaxID=10224 RepID=A0ABM0LYC3_SACKO|nr:PREDICTED: frizzled-7-like [Saccoglossus kowalevskii]